MRIAAVASIAEVNSVATEYGNKVLPAIDLLRIGFLL